MPNDSQGFPNLDAIRNQPSYVPESLPAPIRSNLAPVCDTCYEADIPYPTDSEFSRGRIAEENETGEPGVDLGSRNFNWGTPLVSLPGRGGLDLNIALYYNSLVWTKQDSSIQFNADNGYPSPGFHLGFPTVQERFFDSQVGSWAYMMVTPSGGRVALRQVGLTNIYESMDSSYTQLTDNGGAGAVVRTTDGTQYNFQNMASGEKRCNQIKDRNGNFITITYNGAGRLNTVTDTLGRVINFVYDVDGNLSQLTQSRSGLVDLLVQFGYGVLNVQPTVASGITVFGPVGQNISVLTQVQFSDGLTYNFDYTQWGQVFKIRSHAPDGHMLSYTGYNLPGSEWLGNSTQSDCPRFTQRRDWIEYGVMQTSAEVVSSYAVAADGSWSQVTLPDDTPSNPNDNVVQKEYFATSGWQKGLTTRTEVFHAGSPTVLKKWTTTDWTQDDVNLTYQKNPRPKEINVNDEAGNRRRTTIEYHA
ncbi:MAG: RHS repeat domain-containing protein, partial [Pyrinomonadaceae bacterium]